MSKIFDNIDFVFKFATVCATIVHVTHETNLNQQVIHVYIFI